MLISFPGYPPATQPHQGSGILPNTGPSSSADMQGLHSSMPRFQRTCQDSGTSLSSRTCPSSFGMPGSLQPENTETFQNQNLPRGSIF